MNSHRQKNCGRGISVPILPSRAARMRPAGPQQYFPVSESVHQLPTGRSPAALSRSPRFHSQTSQWLGGEQASFYQGAPRSHGELPFSYDPLTFPYANAHTQRQQGNPCHTARTPLGCGTRATGWPSMLTVTTWPGQFTPVRAQHTLVPGSTPWPLPPRGNTQPSFRQASTGGHLNGTMRRQPGRGATPGPSL